MLAEVVCYQCDKTTIIHIPKHLSSKQYNRYVEMKYNKLKEKESK